MNVDNIYSGESTYNNINKTPVSVYVYIPTNISTNWNGGKLNFWFEDKNGNNKHACTLSNDAHVKGITINITVLLLMLFLIQLFLHLLYYVNLP